MSSSEEPIVMKFKYQQLLGFQVDEKGNTTAKVFEALAVFSDGSEHIIYGIQERQAREIDWNYDPNQLKPKIHMNKYGVKL